MVISALELFLLEKFICLLTLSISDRSYIRQLLTSLCYFAHLYRSLEMYSENGDALPSMISSVNINVVSDKWVWENIRIIVYSHS